MSMPSHSMMGPRMDEGGERKGKERGKEGERKGKKRGHDMATKWMGEG
jgi:hypothetical protein